MRFILFALLLALASTTTHTAPAQTTKAPARKPAATAKPATPAPASTATQAATPAARPAPCDCTNVVQQRHYPPYTAKQESTRVQTLADGTTITNVTESQVWRDANGRTRTETTSTQPGGGTVTQFITVYDPATRTRFSWSTGTSVTSKIVTVYRYPQPVAQPVTTTPVAARRYYPNKNESLPPQTIAGIYVEGYRNSRTIPAGYEGNNRDMTTVNEYWTSPELGIQMRYIIDDPRNGKTTTEVTDLQQTVPDPALFELPQGYTVHENNPQ